MARTAGKKQAPAKIEEEDDADTWEDAVVEADGKDGGADLRLRDWRDVERFREMKELRSLVDDDYGLDEIFRVPLKPRGDARSSKLALPARLAPPPPAKPAGKPDKAGAKGVPAPKAAAAAVPKALTKPAVAHKPALKLVPKGPAPKAPAPKAKAKAKRK